MGESADDYVWIQEGQIKDLWSFILAINWREKWLLVLVAVHILCFIGILMTRRLTNLQLVIFCLLSGLALSSQKINELGAKHWRVFFKEQYFDSHGIFITLVFSGPIMLNCLVLVIIWLFEVGQLLIKTKRRQLLRVTSSIDQIPNEKVKKEKASDEKDKKD